MNAEDYQKIRELCLRSPRMTSLLTHFEEIAKGNKQVPSQPVIGNLDFLARDECLASYYEVLMRNMGTFYKHYLASVPFLLEEHCRIGTAIYKLVKMEAESNNTNRFSYYEINSADGTNGRTIAEFSGGLIRTLTDSPNLTNEINFRQLVSHNYSEFHRGCFVEITPEYLASQTNLQQFADGFDVIHENATFQFFGSEREGQIGYVFRLLKENGLMIFLEKLNQADINDYNNRETIKDKLFKSNYFADDEIGWKRSNMLEDMNRGQVDYDRLVSAIGKYFKYIYLIWNSTNFYEFVASNDERRISQFISLLAEPYIPQPFCFEKPIVKRL
jgi:hypothetical protein